MLKLFCKKATKTLTKSLSFEMTNNAVTSKENCEILN